MSESRTSPEDGERFSASLILLRHIDEIRSGLLQVEKTIDLLRREEDRLRHSLGNERRRREKLQSEASSPGGRDDTAQSQLRLQIEQASGDIEKLQDELKRVGAELTEAEQERDRLRRDVENLEGVNTSIHAKSELHFRWAEFEKQRYERSEEANAASKVRIKALEDLLSQYREEYQQLTSCDEQRSENFKYQRWWRRLWWRRLFKVSK